MKKVMIDGLTLQIQKEGVKVFAHYFDGCNIFLRQTPVGKEWKLYTSGTDDLYRDNCSAASLTTEQLIALRDMIDECLRGDGE